MEADHLTSWISTIVVGIVPKHRRPHQPVTAAEIPDVDIRGMAEQRFAAATGAMPPMSQEFARSFSGDS